MGADLEIEGLSQLIEIGRGGSARVFRAHQDALDRDVAVKVLHSAWDDEVQHRFDRERRAMGRLSDHTGIVPIYATGETATGEPYLVMPYYAKGSLADNMTGDAPMPWQRATALIAAVADTIASAHEQGIIHCDIKPANIMLHDNGQPMVADFGISRTSGTVSITRQSALTFTPAYSPPEVFTDAARAATVDVYGMGATFFALLAGRPPFHGTGPKPDVMAIINRVAHKPVEDLRASIPAPICDFVEQAMAKNPLERPQDVAEFLGGLKVAVRATKGASKSAKLRSPGAPVPLRSISVRRSIAPQPPTNPALVPTPRRRRLGANGIAAAVIAAVLLGGLLAIWQMDRQPEAGATLSPTSLAEDPVTIPSSPPTALATTTTAPAAPTSVASPPRESSSSGPQEAVIEPDGDLNEPDRPQTAPPVISSLAVSGVTETSATITFATNECALSEVRLLSREGTETIKATECSKTHNFPLDDLAPDVSYELTVKATVAGLATSGATSFKTPAIDQPEPPAAPVVSNLRLVTIGQTSAVVAFDTDLCATSAVITIIGSSRGETCTRNHSFEIGTGATALSPSTRYVVLVEASANGRTTSSSLSFTTLDLPAPQAPKPQILSIDAQDITDTSALVLFQTDQCTGMIFSVTGLGSGERGYPRVNECWTTHQILLGASPATSGPLVPGTTYTVTVTARAQDGSSSSARTITFTTKGAAPDPPQTSTTTQPEPTTTTTEPADGETTLTIEDALTSSSEIIAGEVTETLAPAESTSNTEAPAVLEVPVTTEP